MSLVVMAGITLADYFSYLSFWKYFDQRERLTALLNLMGGLRRVAGIGAAFLILTGFGMMALTHGVFGEQLWFRIKIALVVVIIVNSLVFGRRQVKKLRKLMEAPEPQSAEDTRRIKSNLNLFHIIQIGLFMLIIFLSIFKFN